MEQAKYHTMQCNAVQCDHVPSLVGCEQPGPRTGVQCAVLCCAAGLRRLSSLSFKRCSSPGLPGGWTELPQDCLVAIISQFASKNDAAVMRTVCRSWRDGFDLTVRCITIHSNVLLLPQSPSSFANLQHLVVGHISNSAAQAAIRLLAMPSPSLSVLELSHSMLNAVPPDLQQLVGLKTLVMTSNRLKSLAGGRLHLLPNLEHLDLSNNLLSELPACIGSLGTLRKLNVSENNLAHLPEGLGGLTSLQSLRASNNVLLELPDSLVQLQSLTFLDVSLNRLKAVPEGLSRLTQLRQLSVFAAFSHSLRNEGSSTVRVLGQLSMDAPDLHLHAEEVLMGLVKIRKKQLKQAAAQAAASEELDEPAAAATNVLAWYRT